MSLLLHKHNPSFFNAKVHEKTYRRMNRLSLSGQSVDPHPRDILLFTSTSKSRLRGKSSSRELFQEQ